MLKDINEENYTEKYYEFCFNPDDENCFVAYTISWKNGTGIAKWWVEYEGDTIIANRKKYLMYDFPRFEIEIAVRNEIAEQISEKMGYELEYDELLPKNDLGIDKLYDDPYFIESEEDFENYDEEDY